MLSIRDQNKHADIIDDASKKLGEALVWLGITQDDAGSEWPAYVVEMMPRASHAQLAAVDAKWTTQRWDPATGELSTGKDCPPPQWTGTPAQASEALTAWVNLSRATHWAVQSFDGHDRATCTDFDGILGLILDRVRPLAATMAARIEIARELAADGLGQHRERLHEEVTKLVMALAEASAPPPAEAAAPHADRHPLPSQPLVDIASPSRSVSLTRAAKWFDMDKRTLQSSIEDGITKANQKSAKRWVFDLDQIPEQHHRDADPEKYRA